MTYPTITALPTPPSRQDPTTFSDRADDLLGALPDFVTETNTAGAFVQGKAAQVESDKAITLGYKNDAEQIILDGEIAINGLIDETQAIKDDVVILEENVQGVANFKGEWSSLTGALDMPASVLHSGKIWLLLINLADVTVSEPEPTSTDWAAVPSGVELQTITETSTVTPTGDTRYLCNGADDIVLTINTSELSAGSILEVMNQSTTNTVTVANNVLRPNNFSAFQFINGNLIRAYPNLVNTGTSGTWERTAAGSVSWTCPAGIYAIHVILVAGGGGGASGSNCGGGGGGRVRRFKKLVTPGESYTISIGAGGGGGSGASTSNGGGGGNSTAFGYTAVGGGGGNTSGTGGSPNGGDSGIIRRTWSLDLGTGGINNNTHYAAGGGSYGNGGNGAFSASSGVRGGGGGGAGAGGGGSGGGSGGTGYCLISYYQGDTINEFLIK